MNMILFRIFLLTLVFYPLTVWSQVVKYDKRFLQPNGPVYTVEADSAGNKVYVGGQFDYFYETRNKIFAVDTGASLIDRNFPESNEDIKVIISDGNEGVFVAGNFRMFKNVPCINIVHISKNGNVSALPGIYSMSFTYINQVQLLGNRLYIGGGFSNVNGIATNNFFYDLNTDELSFETFPIGKSVSIIKVTQDSLAYISTSDSLILINLHTMQRISSFTPVRISSAITDMEIIGDTLFLCGYFTTVNGQGRLGLASVNRLNGNLLGFDPSPNGNVSDLDQHDGMLLAAGAFTNIGGQARNRFAVLSPVTGGANHVNITTIGTITKMVIDDGRMFLLSSDIVGTPIIERFRVFSLQTWEEDYWAFHCNGYIGDFFIQNGKLYARGSSISEIGHVYAKNLAQIDLVTGYASPVVEGINQRVTSLHLKNGNLYCGGYFTVFGDSVRRGAAAFHIATKQITDWDPFHGLTFYTNPVHLIKSYKDNLFISGLFNWVRDSLVTNFALVDAQYGNSLLNLRVNSEVHTVVYSDTFIYLGGEFTSVLNQSRLRLAQLGFNGLELTNWQPSSNGIVNTILVDSNHVYVGGKFSTIAGLTRSNIAQLNRITGAPTSWNHTFSDTVYSIREVNDSILSITGAFTAFNSDRWAWLKKGSLGLTSFKDFNAYRNVLGDVQVRNFSIGYGHFTDINYSGSDNSNKKHLAFFKSCVMPDIPMIIGDTIVCSGNSTTYSIGNSQLNEADNWSWGFGSCNSTGSLGPNYTLKPTSSGNIYVIPIGECSLPSYCSRLYVKVNSKSSSNLSIKHCKNEYPLVINGKPYLGPGSYKDTLVNRFGCDSVMNITISNNPTDSAFQIMNSCDSVRIGGVWRTVSGVYIDSFKNKYSCDSIRVIDLRLNQSIKTTLQITACDSFQFFNQKLTNSGIYQHILKRSSGCDSIIELQLIVNNSHLTQWNITACKTYDFLGQNITKTGVYNKVYQTSLGCDSIIRLNLTVISINPAVTYSNGRLRATPTGATKYEWLNCNSNYSLIHSSTTASTYEPTQNGSYAVAITNQGCVDTSECFLLNNVGVQTISQNLIKLYPNPTQSANGGIWLQADEQLVKEVVIYNIHGKELHRANIENNLTFIPLVGAEPGSYLAYIISNNGLVSLERFIIIPY